MDITTIPINNYSNRYEEYILGEALNYKENDSDESLGVISSTLDQGRESISFKNNTFLKDIKIKGVINEMTKKIILPQKTFNNVIGTEYINEIYLTTLISGDIDELNLALVNLEKYIISKDADAKVNIYDFIKEDRVEEAKIYAQNIMNIIFITILNSIILTSIWIGNRKFEIAVRKAVGASNIDILRLYFNELFMIGIISILVAIPIYKVLINILDGYIWGFDISFNLIAFLESIGLVFITSFLVSIPILIYLKSLDLNKLLKGD